MPILWQSPHPGITNTHTHKQILLIDIRSTDRPHTRSMDRQSKPVPSPSQCDKDWLEGLGELSAVGNQEFLFKDWLSKAVLNCLCLASLTTCIRTTHSNLALIWHKTRSCEITMSLHIYPSTNICKRHRHLTYVRTYVQHQNPH